MSQHLELGAVIDAVFADDLDSPVEQTQDAMIVRLKNGVTLDVRYAAPDAYSLRWVYGDAESGIDTAPLHQDLASFPNHMHDAGNHVITDPITRPDASPEDNLRRLIRALLDNPMLGVKDSA
jgi:hypothetical protein